MNDKTQQLIEHLAEKLGTTAEHLWGVLVKQAPVSAACDLLGIVILLAAACCTAKFFFRKFQAETRAGGSFDMISPRQGWIIGFVVACLFAILCAICLLDSLPIDIAGFSNPEYWALKQIIK